MLNTLTFLLLEVVLLTISGLNRIFVPLSLKVCENHLCISPFRRPPVILVIGTTSLTMIS